MTRDTNSPAENWFKFLRADVGLGRSLRPAKFVVRKRQSVNGRLKELKYPGSRSIKTTRAPVGSKRSAVFAQFR